MQKDGKKKKSIRKLTRNNEFKLYQPEDVGRTLEVVQV